MAKSRVMEPEPEQQATTVSLGAYAQPQPVLRMTRPGRRQPWSQERAHAARPHQHAHPQHGPAMQIDSVYPHREITLLLQLNTDDRFRGRVFAADLGFSMFTIAVGAYLAGRFLDWGASARMVAISAGLLMLPAAAWAWAMRMWRLPQVVVGAETAA